MRKIIDKFNNRLAALKKDRASHEQVWQEILDHCAPDLTGFINRKQPLNDGQRNDTVIYDGTPIEYAQKCAAGLYASISSPSRPWHRLTMDDQNLADNSENRVWLDDVTDLQRTIMHESNFYQAMYTTYLHQATVGTSAMLILPDYKDVINCIPLPIGSYWLGVNHKGKVDTLYREFTMTALQLKEKFGEEKLPKTIIQSLNNSNGTENPYVVVHVIEPDYHNLAPFKKEWVSVYYLESEHEGNFLDVGGFSLFPVVAPRWFTNYGESYGKMSPGRMALPDCKQLQTMVYDFHEAIQKVNNPPLQGSADLLENNQLATIPGVLNSLRSGLQAGQKIEPLFAVNPDLQAMWQAIQDKKQQIASRFFVDLFMAISMRQDKDMTAYEVRELAGERMLALGPGLENLNNELLDPAIDLIFHYAAEADILPPPPEEIQGQQANPEYVSVLAQAQKMTDVNRITQVVDMCLAWAQADPSVMDNIDLDIALQEADKMIGGPAGIIRSKDAVEKIRVARQEQLEAQKMAESMAQGADIAKTMGDTDMSSEKALGQLFGRMGMGM